MIDIKERKRKWRNTEKQYKYRYGFLDLNKIMLSKYCFSKKHIELFQHQDGLIFGYFWPDIADFIYTTCKVHSCKAFSF